MFACRRHQLACKVLCIIREREGCTDKTLAQTTHLTEPPSTALAALTAAASTTSLLPICAQLYLLSGLPESSREKLASKTMSAALDASQGSGTNCKACTVENPSEPSRWCPKTDRCQVTVSQRYWGQGVDASVFYTKNLLQCMGSVTVFQQHTRRPENWSTLG